MYFNIFKDLEAFDNSLMYQNPNLADLFMATERAFEEPTATKPQSLNLLNLQKGKRTKGELKTIEENQYEDELSKESDNGYFNADDHFGKSKTFPYLDLKSSDEVSLIDTEPEVEFLVSVQPSMYRASNFLNIKDALEDNEADDILLEDQPQVVSNEEEQKENKLVAEFKKTCGFRFLKKRTYIFQATSK